MTTAASSNALADASQPLRLVEAEIGKVLVGQRDLMRFAIREGGRTVGSGVVIAVAQK